MGRTRERVGAVLLGALSLAPAVPAAAAGVDGAGRVVIIPLVVTGEERESKITLTNTGSEFVRVTGLYVGVEGTPRAASVAMPIPCDPQLIPREGSLTLKLRDLCPGRAHPRRREHGLPGARLGRGRASELLRDERDGLQQGTSFGVVGQPIGAYDPGLAGVRRAWRSPACARGSRRTSCSSATSRRSRSERRWRRAARREERPARASLSLRWTRGGWSAARCCRAWACLRRASTDCASRSSRATRP